MLQSQTASASDVKQSQEEKDRAFAEQLHNELNCEFPRCPPDGSASLGEDDLYADNGFHLYEDSQLVRSNDEVIAAILQTDAIVPDSRPIIVDRKTDLAIALELQQAEMGALCLSDSHIANEIANQEMNTGHDSVLAREIADEELSNQLQGDEKMAQHLSQAESQYSEQHELPAMSDACPFGMTDPPPVQYNHNHQQHQHHWRQRRGGMQGHRAGHGQHEEVEGDNYEDLLELEERIGDAEGQGLNPNQLSMLPVSKYTSSSSEDNECKVCFSKFELDETVRTLPCCHLFHRDCIDNWIKDHNSCPICRKGIREELHH